MRRHICLWLVVAVSLAPTTSALACTLCDPSNLKTQTFRQEARTSKIVAIGTLTNARLVGDNGYTDLVFDDVIKDDAARGKKHVITLPRWVPIDPKKPPQMLMFIDVYDGKIDPFRGVSVHGKGLGDYLRGALAIDDRDRMQALNYAFKHLDSADPEVAADAFLELGKASDREIGEVGPKLDPAKLRKLLADPKTQQERLGLFAFLLGASGTKGDAEMLSQMVDRTDDRTTAALGGILGGLIELRPEQGWQTVVNILNDPKRPFTQKLNALGTIRFFQASAAKTHRKSILAAAAVVVSQGDLSDMAVEDLRRWQWWELTDNILSQYDKKTHAAPLVRNAILRYAVTCPDPNATAFVASLRATDPVRIREIEESLSYERSVNAKPKK